MPYRVAKRKDKNSVEKPPSGEEIACHDSEDEAFAQMRALYASEND